MSRSNWASAVDRHDCGKQHGVLLRHVVEELAAQRFERDLNLAYFRMAGPVAAHDLREHLRQARDLRPQRLVKTPLDMRNEVPQRCPAPVRLFIHPVLRGAYFGEDEVGIEAALFARLLLEDADRHVIVRGDLGNRGIRCNLHRISAAEIDLVALEGATYPVTALAVEPTELRGWPKQTLARLLERFPQVRTNIMREMTAHMTDALTRVRELTTERVGQRLRTRCCG
jgi:hypothetical protein